MPTSLSYKIAALCNSVNLGLPHDISRVAVFAGQSVGIQEIGGIIRLVSFMH